MQAPPAESARSVSRVLAFVPFLGVGVLLAQVGWPHAPGTAEALRILSRVLAGLYGALYLLRFAVRGDLPARWRGEIAGLGIAILLLGTAVFEPRLEAWLAHHLHGFGLHGWFVMIAAGQQLLAWAVHLRDLLPWIERHVIERFSPAQLMLSTFAGLILGGTLLLKMPACSHGPFSWLDAWFTATSAVCVTGLVVVDTASQFTLLGQGVVLLLIQVGGFGIVILTFFLAMLAGQGLSISSRVLLRDLLSEDNLRSLGSALVFILGATLFLELAGTGALFWCWRDEMGIGRSPLWLALFHSVSAFCNAGFSIFPEGLMAEAARSKIVQAIIMALIILGGLGFPVLFEIARRISPVHSSGRRTRRWSLHTRLVLTTTAILLGAGTLLLWIGQSSATEPSSAWEAFFNAVTARTAGFNISPMTGLTAPAVAIMVLLMFVGGSPGGIAGGVKTTTFAVAILNLRRILTGRRDVQLGGRRLEENVCHRAFAIILLSQLWILLASGLILFFQPEYALIDTLFETVSAFATVGLSRDLTATLLPASKLVILLTMFVGRIGILNFFFSFLAHRGEPRRVRFPSERVIID